jgi:hypothetical protein
MRLNGAMASSQPWAASACLFQTPTFRRAKVSGIRRLGQWNCCLTCQNRQLLFIAQMT